MIEWRSLTLDALLVTMILGSIGYLRRVSMPRPPVGRFTGGDIAIMSVMLVVLPAAYLRLPAAAVSAVFGVVLFTAIQSTLAPLVGGRVAPGIAALLIAAEIAAHWTGHADLMLVVNDALLTGAVIGIVNVWVQAGMSAAHVTGLAVVLTFYDIGATWLGSFTQDFLNKVASEPFLPMLAVVGGKNPGGLGLGDCLVLAVWPVTLLKAFGRRPAWVGAVVGLTVAVLIEFAFKDHWVGFYAIIPTMSIVGPLIVLQYVFLRRRFGSGRRTAAWLARGGTTPDDPAAGVALRVDQALAACSDTRDTGPGEYLALIGGRFTAAGPTPGAARRAARLAGAEQVPVVVHASLVESLQPESLRPESLQPGGPGNFTETVRR